MYLLSLSRRKGHRAGVIAENECPWSFFSERKVVLYYLTSYMFITASTGIIIVSKIALHFSELKTETRTGAPFQVDRNYENGKMRF